jgi:hypothetical protein
LWATDVPRGWGRGGVHILEAGLIGGSVHEALKGACS